MLRDGRNAGEAPIDEMTRQRMIQWMVGREIENEFPRVERSHGDIVLRAERLSRGNAVRDVSLHVRSGEILGLTGLVGAGRTETARLIFGADRADGGQIFLNDQLQRIRSPRDAISAEICLLTEDRKSQGLILDQSVRHNFGLPNMNSLSRLGFVAQTDERQDFARFSERMRIKIPHDDQLAGNLSGGNQQKVVLAKWLQRNARVVIFDEPTRGIDVGAKYEIYMLMNELAADGKAIIMISSELPEVLGMSRSNRRHARRPSDWRNQ